jgi:7-keto-8-aminopelargonate synthetase-like enzyme
MGLIGDPRIDGAAIEVIRKYGTGTGGRACLREQRISILLMEHELTTFRGTEAAHLQFRFMPGVAEKVAAKKGAEQPHTLPTA